MQHTCQHGIREVREKYTPHDDMKFWAESTKNQSLPGRPALFTELSSQPTRAQSESLWNPPLASILACGNRLLPRSPGAPRGQCHL